MIITKLYKEHAAAKEGYTGPLGTYLQHPLFTLLCMYYRLNNEISAKGMIDKTLEEVKVIGDPLAFFKATTEPAGICDNLSAGLIHLVHMFWGATGPDKRELMVISDPIPDEWYLAVVEGHASLLNREYTEPAIGGVPGAINKLNYTDEENPNQLNSLGFIGFYNKDVGFVFFDCPIGSLNPDEIGCIDYKLLRNWE